MPVLTASDQLTIGISFEYSAQNVWAKIGDKNKVPIFLIGQAPNAPADKFPVNTLTLIDSPDTAESVFGDDLTDNEFALPVEILQRYGCQRIICCRIIYPDNEADYGKAIIGTDTPTRTGLYLIKSVFSRYGMNPVAALACNESLFLDETYINWIDSFANLMEEVSSTYVENYPVSATVDDVETSRSGNTGWGTKSERLILCYGHVKDKEEEGEVVEIEPIKYHFVGAFAKQFHDDPSVSPGGNKLLGVSQVVESMMLSTIDANSDNERITDEGVVTLNRISTINRDQIAADDQTVDNSELVVWGTRNTLFPEDKGLFSFLHAIPFRDYIASVLEARASKFLHRTANTANGRNIEESCREGLSRYKVKVEFIPERSNFEENYLHFEVEYSISSVTQRIHFNVQLQLANS
jgi:phage tail sheath protein FI